MSGRIAMSRARVLIFSILSGVCFSVIGMVYTLGKQCAPQVSTHQIMVVLSLGGTLFFLARLLRRPRWREVAMGQAPRRVWVWGALAGAGQVLLVCLLDLALTLGLPLTPIWCAIALSFVVVITYSRLAFREHLDVLKLLAILAAGGCIVISSSTGDSGTSGAAGDAGAATWLLLGCILAGVVLCNSFSQVGLKDLGMHTLQGQTLMERHSDVFMLLLYGMLAVGSIACCIAMGLPLTWTSLGLGVAAAVGSVGGLSLLSSCASAPAATVFTVSGIMSVLAASLVSVVALGEEVSRVWVGTMSLAVAAIVLGSGVIVLPASKPADAASPEPVSQADEARIP